MLVSRPSEHTLLEEISRSVRLARESISLAGSLAHTDPDEAWNVTLEAKDHCTSALAELDALETRRNDEVELVSSAFPPRLHDAEAVHRLLVLLKAAARADNAEESDNVHAHTGENEGHVLSRAAIIDHVADLCKEAVEEGMMAHSLATEKNARDSAWTSVMASVEAIYALLLLGAALPIDPTFEESDLDLAALHLVEEINLRVLSRVTADSV